MQTQYESTPTVMGATGRKNPDWQRLAAGILSGDRLARAEARSVLDSTDDELPALLAATFHVRQRYFGRTVQLYYLRNAKSGLCSEDCHYCSQSAISEAPIERYSLQDEETLLEGARAAAAANARTYCIVASGRGPGDREVDRIAEAVKRIKDELGLHVCCCLGILSADQAARLQAAGVDRINHNLNTSRRFHEEICSTHTFDDRITTLRTARDAGLELCAGLIVGMGETHDDVVDVAMELAELRVESIPVNFLNPIPGTPLESRNSLTPRDCLRVLCLFRLACPETEIRIAGGREVQLRSLQPMGLYAANSMFVSDYLTTPGQPAEQDFEMIRDLGFEVVTEPPGWSEPGTASPS